MVGHKVFLINQEKISIFLQFRRNLLQFRAILCHARAPGSRAVGPSTIFPKWKSALAVYQFIDWYRRGRHTAGCIEAC
jgi:hypothetical protein